MAKNELSERERLAEDAAFAICDQLLRYFDSRLQVIEKKVEAVFRIYQAEGKRDRQAQGEEVQER